MSVSAAGPWVAEGGHAPAATDALAPARTPRAPGATAFRDGAGAARRYLFEVPAQRRSHGMSGLDVRSLATAVWVRGFGRDAAEGELQAVLDALTDTADPR